MSMYKECMYTIPYIMSIFTMTTIIESINGKILWGVLCFVLMRGILFFAFKLRWKMRFVKFMNHPLLSEYENDE